ncbi:uncharacterized protein EI97DRAFT_429505 [Westerdykella ornata]|uniref:Mif2/CENP-C cupin domain-containing protein n=1 Tax=Westerdykella ornata TaxID=318751 RepID=A0A6A6K265_WESOR|nr:uncharacterized protein EI97DRAFT_429505 [Westerdykella ornata]KAF2281479.1 hypothetical protein EI97DRAFT_429505 [Westerdykella ornata]
MGDGDGDGTGEESFVGLAEGDDVVGGADIEESLQEELSRVEGEDEPVLKQPARRGRKRKSDGLESNAENESSPAVRSKRTRTANAQASAAGESRKTAPKPRGRPPRQQRREEDVVDEEDHGAADASLEDAAQPEETPVPVPKKRGRRPKAQASPVPDNVPEEESSLPAKRRGRPPKEKPAKPAAAAAESTEDTAFKKPTQPARKPKAKATERSATAATASIPPDLAAGKLVDSLGNPIPREELDKRSVTSAGSSFRRARQLSVFREVGPDEIGRVGRSGRHHVKPIDFWMNERAEYGRDGTLKAITHHLEIEEEAPRRRKRKAGSKKKGRKRGVGEEGSEDGEEEEEMEREEWEVNEGVFVGAYREFDVATETTGEEMLQSTLAWAEKGIVPQQVPNAQFKFTKLGSAGERSFFSWGCIELDEGDIKRSKNSRRMHMVFHVTRGRVEVSVNEENVFGVGKGGVWQVPRGNNYSIRNLAKGKTRVFFAQAYESTVAVE